METGVDDPDYQNEIYFVKSLMDDSKNNIKGLITSIRPEDNSSFDKWLDESISIGVAGYRRILHEMPDDTSQSSTFRKVTVITV